MSALEKTVRYPKTPDLTYHKGGKGEHPRRPIRRILAVGAAAIVLAVAGGTWFANQGGGPKPSETPAPTVPATPSSSSSEGTPTPIITETPTAGPTRTPEITLSPEHAAPDIPGLHKVVENGVVVYRADKVNNYELHENDLGAIYNENVSVGGTEVGGIALEAHVATKYLKASGEIPAIFIPVDLRSATNVSITSSKTPGGHDDISITSDGTTTLTDIWPGTRSFNYGLSPALGTGFFDARFTSKSGDAWSPTNVYAENYEGQRPTKASSGQSMGTATGKVTITYGYAGNAKNLELSNLAHIGNSPLSVFI